MKRRLALLVVPLLLFGPTAHAYDDGSDDCQGGGCGTHHRHDGDTCISPCSIIIIVPPVSNSPTTTTTRRGVDSPACLVPVPYHCDQKPKENK